MGNVAFRLAVDIGGTFTDGVVEIESSGELVLAKRLTTYADPSIAVSEVIGDLLSKLGDLGAARGVGFVCTEVVHGTTLVTNAIIEREGARVAMFVTAGTRDVLQMRREVRYDLYDLDIEFPEPLVPPERIFEISARMDASGRIVRPLADEEVRTAIRAMKDDGVTAIAVSLLHGYLNPEHEERVGAIIAEEFPEATVSLSSRIASEVGEFERSSTCVANAFVQPLASDYLRRLSGRLADHGIDAPLRIMTSNGGFVSDQTAAEVPIDLLESGPAGGVRSAINTASADAVDKILTFDMGGTTAKACVCLNGVPELTYSFEAARVARFKKGSGLPILIPSIDLIEIGAGGGSIAYQNDLGLMNVGPQSASSEPGPACYGLGGAEPTVTDADLLLGYLDPDWFLGGAMKLNREAARQAVGALGEKLGLGELETAWGIHNVVSENMAGAARVHAAEKGLDPRNLTLVATGGAGPVHAVEVAAKLGMRRIVFTIAAGVGSCLGFLAAPARMDRAWSYVERVDRIDPDKVNQSLSRLARGIEGDLAKSNVPSSSVIWSLGVEMRYAGQGHSIQVKRPYGDITADGLAALSEEFEAGYERAYGTRIPGGVPQVVTWRLSAQSESQTREFRLADTAGDRGGAAPVGSRMVYQPAEGCLGEVPVYRRYELPAGTTLTGPLILVEDESTIVVARPAAVEIQKNGTVSVSLG